jgi:hypothetical protein
VECLILRGEQPEWFENSGEGYGYGSCYGSGSCYGDGYGYGSCYGSGSCYGDGSGDGDGYGDGYGYGYGSGDGDGYGSGYGYGYGSGSGSYWLKTIKYFAEKWTDSQHARMEELRALGAKICFWRSMKDGRALHCSWASAGSYWPARTVQQARIARDAITAEMAR